MTENTTAETLGTKQQEVVAALQAELQKEVERGAPNSNISTLSEALSRAVQDLSTLGSFY